jgi:acetyl-CoA carboxylase beta subunit
MIGRKLSFIDISRQKNIENIFKNKEIDLNKIKIITIKNTKKIGLVILVLTLRFSIKTSYLIKNGYKITKNKINIIIDKNLQKKENKEKEVSNFLKMVSGYKDRIRKIRHKIKEEEGIE